MPANECIPYKMPAITFTAKATAAITGKRFVVISGDRTGGGGPGAAGSTTVGAGLSSDVENVYRVKLAGAGVAAVGVSGWDAAINEELKVYGAVSGVILPVKAGEALVAGDEVMSNATGEAVKYVEGATKKAIGMAMTKAANAEDAEIKLY